MAPRDDPSSLDLSADLLLSMDSTAESFAAPLSVGAQSVSMPLSFDDDDMPPALPSEGLDDDPVLFEDVLLNLQEAHDGEVTGLREENAKLHQEFIAEFGPLATVGSSASKALPSSHGGLLSGGR